MRWLLAPHHDAPVGLSITFDAFEPGGDEGRVTFVHWTPDGAELTATIDAMLLSAPLSLPGRLWRRDHAPPHDRSLERLQHILDETVAAGQAVAHSGPVALEGNLWAAVALDIQRARRSAQASAGGGSEDPSPLSALSATLIEDVLETLRAPGTPEALGDEIHAHFSVIADRRRAATRGMDDAETLDLLLCADAFDRAAQRWLSHRVRQSRR